MITIQVPLRICLAGGGSDLPEYWRAETGFVVSAAISLYLTVTVSPGNRLVVGSPHPYALAAGWSPRDLVEIESDVPAGSGLGGSGALMVALLKARRPELPRPELAAAAYHLERYHLGKHCGLQDHWIAALGGAITIEIEHDGAVTTGPVRLPPGFEERLLLMRTPIRRDADVVLSSQSHAIVSAQLQAESAMLKIHLLGEKIWRDLVTNDGRRFGELTRQHWEAKRASTEATSTSQIDGWVDLADREGAEAAKCIGAGAGGYLLFVVPEQRREHLARVMTEAGLSETPFRFVDEGASIA